MNIVDRVELEQKDTVEVERKVDEVEQDKIVKEEVDSITENKVGFEYCYKFLCRHTIVLFGHWAVDVVRPLL